MEKSLTLLEHIKEQFQCEEVDVHTYSPLTLAYIGDCIFDLVIRSVIVLRGNRGVNGLHKSATHIVKAETQAKMIEALQSDLTEEEMAVYKRGRNAKSHSSAKNASLGAYRKATGYEALIGYLYLTNQMERAVALIKLGLERVEMEI
ncbi:MAG: ribonuclease III [Lachnospiraceae bacterium]|nr:ribonuclease III [Lachnospiraceae bacterium]